LIRPLMPCWVRVLHIVPGSRELARLGSDSLRGFRGSAWLLPWVKARSSLYFDVQFGILALDINLWCEGMIARMCLLSTAVLTSPSTTRPSRQLQADALTNLARPSHSSVVHGHGCQVGMY
jgi:hypothetical protein